MTKKTICLLVVVVVGAIFLSGCFEKEPGSETDEPLTTVTPQITTPVPTVRPTPTARPVTRPPLAMIGSAKAEFLLRSGDIEYSVDVIIQNTGKTSITFDSVEAFFYDQKGGFITTMETGPVTLKPSQAISQHFESYNAYQLMRNVEAAGKKNHSALCLLSERWRNRWRSMFNILTPVRLPGRTSRTKSLA